MPESTWTTTGILKSQSEGEGRVVLEALSLVTFDGVVVRVYQEDPLIIHFAKRASSQPRIDAITKEAASVFETLPGHIEEVEAEEDLACFGIDLREALNPIPPPFLMEQITDAEQAVAHQPA